jgi:hypothetical protein
MCLLVILAAFGAEGRAQSSDVPASPEEAASAPAAHDHAAMAGHDHAAMLRHEHAMATGALGPHPMTREASGTSWQPDATPMPGLHFAEGDWSLMAHGLVNVVRDRQTGPRGDTMSFSESMAMLMGRRAAGPGTLALRGMLSLDPTMGPRGYPLLFQTGETADGVTPLVDRQHPHDFFMELSGSYSVPWGTDGSAFLYLGLPGEPALGPPAFMHRASALRNPEAPLTHHWLDSTHVTFGVATVGASRGPLQLEASWFNGREPDESRWNIETRAFDSWSTRLSFNPAPALSMQVSYGDLRSPEQLEPDVRVRRTTASVSWQAKPHGDDWATTLAWGLNRKTGHGTDRSEPGWLLESTYVLRDRHTFFGRAEQLRNSELFAEGDPLHGQAFRIRKFTLGYIVDVARTGPVRWGVGGLVGFLDAPSELDAVYGRNPRSYMLFLQARL